MQKVVIQIDELKPHQAESQGLLKEAEFLGFSKINLQGSYDDKLTYIYGEVEDYEAVKEKFDNSVFSHMASLFKVS